MKCPRNFFDTNVLIYALAGSGSKTRVAEELLIDGGFVSVQILNELAAVLRRKFTGDMMRVRDMIEAVIRNCPDPLPLSLHTHRIGLRLCERYGFSIYDGTMIASAQEAGCKILYTEDLHHGQVIDGLRVENPFRNL
ncbi:MAG: PIN domain-containing protein [Acidobacteriota bacterium]